MAIISTTELFARYPRGPSFTRQNFQYWTFLTRFHNVNVENGLTQVEGRLWQRVKLMTWQCGWILPQDECGHCSSWKWAERWLWGRERVSRSQSQIRHFPWGQDISGPCQPSDPHWEDNLVRIVINLAFPVWITLSCSREETSTFKSCIPNRHRQVKKSYAMQQGVPWRDKITFEGYHYNNLRPASPGGLLESGCAMPSQDLPERLGHYSKKLLLRFHEIVRQHIISCENLLCYVSEA